MIVNKVLSKLLLLMIYLQGFSCIDLQNAGMRQSGVYYLQIRGTTYWFLKVFCEQEIADGGWTVSCIAIITMYISGNSISHH